MENTKSSPIYLNSKSILRLSGEQNESFLQGQIACDLRELADYQGQFSILANIQGRIKATTWVFRKGDDLYLILPKNTISLIENDLKKYARFSKVTISQENHLLCLGYFDLPGLQKNAVYIPLKNKRGILIIEKEEANLNIENDETQWCIENIKDQIPDIDLKTKEQFLPHPLNMPALGGISFKKGCYLGQEIIARMQYKATIKQHLYAFSSLELPQKKHQGEIIYDLEGEILGEIVNQVENYFLVTAKESILKQTIFKCGENGVLYHLHFGNHNG